MSADRYRTHDVEVAGGALRVGEWSGGGGGGGDGGGDGGTVLALHGITAHHRGWPLVAEALPGRRVLAPDLRGRGRSNGLPGPWGMAAHADDAADVVGHLAEGPVTVVGHSMGGFVAVVLAHRHPDLVRRLVLVDGGLPFAPAELESTRAGLALIRQRLEARLPDAATYVDLFRQHPAFARDWSPEAEGYAAYDVVPADDGSGAVRSSAHLDAVLADQTDLLDGDDVPAALETLEAGGVPAVFLHAPRGFVDDPPGLYAPGTVRDLAERFPHLEVRAVDDVNHYTVVLSARGAAAVAAAVDGDRGR